MKKQPKPSCPLLPCADFVVLLPEAAPTRGRIIVDAEAASPYATVAAVGPDVEELPVGARVLYRMWLTEVVVAETRWLLVKLDDVLARVG